MIKAQSAYQRVVTNTKLDGGSVGHEGGYCVENCRYANVLQMIRDGASDEAIIARYPEFAAGEEKMALTVYRKIVNGTLTRGHKYGPHFKYGNGKYGKKKLATDEDVNTAFIKRLEGISDAHIRTVINLLQKQKDML